MHIGHLSQRSLQFQTVLFSGFVYQRSIAPFSYVVWFFYLVILKISVIYLAYECHIKLKMYSTHCYSLLNNIRNVMIQVHYVNVPCDHNIIQLCINALWGWESHAYSAPFILGSSHIVGILSLCIVNYLTVRSGGWLLIQQSSGKHGCIIYNSQFGVKFFDC